MASSKQKKVVSQEQLRRLMKEKQYTAKVAAKRIEHPHAKYNSLNQLTCTLCTLVIKTDNLWTAHIQSAKHKEKYLASKTQGPAKPAELTGIKRKLTDAEILSAKKPKVSTSGSNGLTQVTAAATSSTSSKQAGKMTALAGYSSSSEDEEEEEEGKDTKSQPVTTPAQVTSSNSSNPAGSHGLPTDFFDSGVKTETDKDEGANAKPATMAEALPEGFFDDPKMDAKVRQVIYKDKMEEEWELFQKSMKEETHVSEAIIEEEDEQVNVERNLDEIDDQMQRWQEVEDLHIKKETIAKTTGDDKEEKDSDELDEEDLDQFLDWRSKKSWK